MTGLGVAAVLGVLCRVCCEGEKHILLLLALLLLVDSRDRCVSVGCEACYKNIMHLTATPITFQQLQILCLLGRYLAVASTQLVNHEW